MRKTKKKPYAPRIVSMYPKASEDSSHEIPSEAFPIVEYIASLNREVKPFNEVEMAIEYTAYPDTGKQKNKGFIRVYCTKGEQAVTTTYSVSNVSQLWDQRVVASQLQERVEALLRQAV